jgi:hypothetical protein
MELSIKKKGDEIFLFCKLSSPALGPIRPSVQSVIGTISSELNLKINLSLYTPLRNVGS